MFAWIRIKHLKKDAQETGSRVAMERWWLGQAGWGDFHSAPSVLVDFEPSHLFQKCKSKALALSFFTFASLTV